VRITAQHGLTLDVAREPAAQPAAAERHRMPT
jgi:hypothetical protein